MSCHLTKQFKINNKFSFKIMWQLNVIAFHLIKNKWVVFLPVQSWATYTQRSFNTGWEIEALFSASLKEQCKRITSIAFFLLTLNQSAENQFNRNNI